MATELVGLIDQATDPLPHAELLHSSWGALSEAVEQIATAEEYEPGEHGHPGIEAILAINTRLGQSPYPEPLQTEKEGSLLAWGSWDVRVHAASSAMRLAQRFADTHPEILDDLELFARDPVRTVRLQVAQSVNGLWDVARVRMWELADYIAMSERDIGVLAYFIGGPLHRFVGADAAHAERLLSTILDRIPAPKLNEQSGLNDFYEAVGTLVAWRSINADSPVAWARFGTWIDDPVNGDKFLWALLFSLRSALFLGYRAPAMLEDVALRKRAKRMFEGVVVAAVAAKQRAEPVLRSGAVSDAVKVPMVALSSVGDRLLDHVCNQFYFGSGAFRQSSEESSGVEGQSEKLAFLEDYHELLGEIGQHGSAHAIHRLIELYVFLAEASPANVFDHVASIITGPAVGENYHLEGLGAGTLISLVRVYLADYRAIFDDPARRSHLVAVLETFSSAGWPEALLLLYELPDLLR